MAMKLTMKVLADSKEELQEAVAQHVVKVNSFYTLDGYNEATLDGERADLAEAVQAVAVSSEDAKILVEAYALEY